MSHNAGAIDTDKLVPTSTDMMPEFLANSEKLISSDKRWKYADHRDSPDSAQNGGGHTYDDELDDDFGGYSQTAPHNPGVFAAVSQAGHSGHGDHNEHATQTDNTYYDTDTHNPRDTAYSDSSESPFTEKPLSRDEMMLAKLTMLRKLGELKQCGVKLSQNYGLDSDLKMMEYEHKLHNDIRAKQNSVQWMGHMLIGLIKGGEMLNDSYNPFDIRLEGLSTKVSSDMNAYYSVLGEIYEKYNQPGKQMAPEFKLLMMITGAALSMQVNRALPGFMGGVASSVKNDESMKEELRETAARSSGHDTRSRDSASRMKVSKIDKAGDQGGQAGPTVGPTAGRTAQTYEETEHMAATQRVADLRFIKEKELEVERLKAQAELARQKNAFALSSEEPDPEPQFSPEQIEMMRKERLSREQQHLNNLRQRAQMNSNAYRTGSSQAGSFDRARADNLSRQTRNLDDILDSIESPAPQYFEQPSHPERTTRTTRTTRSTRTRSSRKSDEQSVASVASSASSTSFNPDMDRIMKKTGAKQARQQAKQSIKSRSKSSTSKSNKVDADERINHHADRYDEQYEDLSVDDISVGSQDKGTKPLTEVTVKFENLTDSSSGMLVTPNKSNTKSSKSKTTTNATNDNASRSSSKGSKRSFVDDLDIGAISLGSSKKGTMQSLVTGKN